MFSTSCMWWKEEEKVWFCLVNACKCLDSFFFKNYNIDYTTKIKTHNFGKIYTCLLNFSFMLCNICKKWIQIKMKMKSVSMHWIWKMKIKKKILKQYNDNRKVSIRKWRRNNWNRLSKIACSKKNVEKA